jgi:arylsulfatase A-like enzyme
MRREFVAILAAAIVAIWTSNAAPQSSTTRRPNIVFIVADTLRRDHVGVYGSAPTNTPFLDSLAARAVVFDRAFAQTPWTAPSVASMFTSRYQSQHRIIAFGDQLSTHETTLAELLGQNGYATGAFAANLFLQSDWGFGKGFQKFTCLGSIVENESPKGSGTSVNQAALEWLDDLGNDRPPLFLYLHYMEPHIPYEPPEDLLSQALGGRPRPDVTAINDALLHRFEDLTSDELEQAKLLYRVVVADLDRQLQRLFAELEKRGILRESVFVFTADHGEEMSEHGWWGHGMSLYNDVIRVPLLISTPHQTKREDVAENVALVDIAPTILELAGIAPPSTFEGRSLAHVRRQGPGSGQGWFAKTRFWFGAAPVPVASENLPSAGISRPTSHARTILLGMHKLVRDTEGHSDYYDLQRDPGERSPIQSFDGIPSSLQYAFAKFVHFVGLQGPSDPTSDIDEKTKARMRALGYVQ